MDKSKKIIILVSVIFVICLSIILGYNFVKEDKKVVENNNNNIQNNNNFNNNENNVENKDKEEKNLKYRNIELGSHLASELIDFVPKHFFTYENKMNEEYMIYSALDNLKETDSSYHIENVYKAFKKEVVEKEVQKIFGEDEKVTRTKFNDFPIIYDEKNDLYAIISSGFGKLEERYDVKEIKENDEEFIVNLYTVILKYEYNNEGMMEGDEIANNFTYLYTKDAIKNLGNESKYLKKIESKESGIDTSEIIKLYKNEIPVISYKLKKNDIRGTSYYVDSINFLDSEVK